MKSYDKKINQLIAMYVRAEKNLVNTISQKKYKGQVTDFYEAMLKQVKLQLMQLQAKSVVYSKDIVNDLYLEAYYNSLKNLGISDIGDGFAQLHTDAIELLSDNIINNFAEVNNQVGRRIEDTIRDIGLTNTQMKFATGQTIRQLQNELIDNLVNTGLGGITDKRGRVIPFTTYAELLARSIVAETQNTSVMNVAKEYKKDLVKMTKHNTACAVCQEYEGKIYSISGKSEKYPALKSIPGFSKGYNNIHPRCRHRLSVHISKYDDEYIKQQEEKEKQIKIKNKENEVPKNKNGNEIIFDLGTMKEEKQIKIKEIITELASQYNTSLNGVYKGSGHSAGKVDMAYNMHLGSSRKQDVVHEFGHSLAISPKKKFKELGNEDFWKEIKKVRREYKKACADNPSKLISAYSTETVDEFMAEAFTHSYLKGTKYIEEFYGEDFEYSDKVMKIIDKYFKK